MTSAASAIDRHPGWQNRVSDARVVGAKPPFWWVTRAFIGIVVVAASMLGWGAVRDSLIAQGEERGRESAQTELRQLRTNLTAAKAEIERMQLIIKAKDSRIDELSADKIRLEGQIRGHRAQAAADIKTVTAELKVKSPPPARNKRR